MLKSKGVAAAELQTAGAAPVPIEPGTQKLTVMVEVVYDIDQ